MKPFTEEEVLEELDYASKVAYDRDLKEPSKYRDPARNYNYFLDLELPYNTIAGNRIHLYADDDSWAVVFEVSSYNEQQSYPQFILTYVGSALDCKSLGTWENAYLDHLMDFDEYESIVNTNGVEMETYQLMSKDVSSVKILGKEVHFKNDYRELEKIGIEIRDFDNSQKLIDFEAFFRYLNETQPNVLYVSESEIKKHFLKDIPKLMTIDKYHYTSIYDKVLPSQQELFQLIAKILVTKDTTLWKPTQPTNNHWSNWESGFL